MRGIGAKIANRRVVVVAARKSREDASGSDHSRHRCRSEVRHTADDGGGRSSIRCECTSPRLFVTSARKWRRRRRRSGEGWGSNPPLVFLTEWGFTALTVYFMFATCGSVGHVLAPRTADDDDDDDEVAARASPAARRRLCGAASTAACHGGPRRTTAVIGDFVDWDFVHKNFKQQKSPISPNKQLASLRTIKPQTRKPSAANQRPQQKSPTFSFKFCYGCCVRAACCILPLPPPPPLPRDPQQATTQKGTPLGFLFVCFVGANDAGAASGGHLTFGRFASRRFELAPRALRKDVATWDRH